MGTIGCGFGSDWHMLRYLGYHRSLLTEKVLEITGGDKISWLDHNFSTKNKPLGRDRELIGIEFIDNPKVKELWRNYWPQSGNAQNWDAVGQIYFHDKVEWLLVEAKGHLGEVVSSCAATSEKSITLIKSALAKTMEAIGIDSKSVDSWLTPYYQYANRLAVLNFFEMECIPKIPARLLFIYFFGDIREDSADCPQSTKRWKQINKEIHDWLGLPSNFIFQDRVHDLFLPVNPTSQIE